jgi:Ni,Fe-hydrogenase III large subunit/NADH:ubiquinone oxidoreductase subunit C
MAKFDEAVKVLQDNLGDDILESKVPKSRRAYILVKPGRHREAISLILKNIKEVALSTISGVDLGEEIELNYHMRCNGSVTIRNRVPKENPKIQTITDLIPGATLYEREAFDLLGVMFEGHPNLKRLMLPEDWNQGEYPLRKDWKPQPPQNITSSSENASETGNEEPVDTGTVINVVVGPQHPALHEPEKFTFKIDGERVVDVEPRLGYVHRGIEKAAERMMYFQDVHLVERICGICNAAHTTVFCQAVEDIGNIEVPDRARYLRTVIFELNRIHSHLLLLGVAGHLIGYEALFQHIWRDREPVMDTVERITGNRLMNGYNTIGGVRRDITPTKAEKILKTAAEIRKRAIFYKTVIEEDPTIRLRTEGVGMLSKADALKYCVVGPVARASGIDWDVRRDDPYAAYEEIPFNVISYDTCDSWGRLMVRAEEVLESMDILIYALEHLPEGKLRVRVSRRQPEGEAVSRVEAARGELIHYVKSDGSAYPYRVKVRSPSMANLVAFPAMIKGYYIADIPAALGSLDPCFSCTDRMAFKDTQNSKSWYWSLEDVNNAKNRDK